jgi:GT2 family glycosyltransferase
MPFLSRVLVPRPAPVAPERLDPASVTVIVLNWNRRDETLACLDSLARAALGGAVVMVVDNGSRDGSVEAIRARHPAVRVVALAENQGYAGGNNAGIRAALEAGAGAVLLLNNDTVVAPDFLAPLLEVLNADARAAAASSAIMRADSPEALDIAYLDVYFGHGLVHRRGVNALPGEGFDAVKPVSAGVGCSLLVRAAALRQVGLFDEAYFAYHEEVDWCYRARKGGWLVYFQPYSRIWHHGSRSTVPLAGSRPARETRGGPELPNVMPLSWNPVRTYLGARNAVRFVRRHGGIVRKTYFVVSSLYALPLALLAIVMDREEDLMLGLWTYRRALKLYCFPPPFRLRQLFALPGRLLRDLPADVARAHRADRTAQLIEHLRGLRDGFRDAPLPLERLGLR